MTLATAIANDYTLFDGNEAITLQKPGTTTTTAVSAALRRAGTTREAAASQGKYTTADVGWHLPQSLVTTQPALGDKVLDSAAVYWTILDVTKATLGTRWKCVTRDVAVANRLDCWVAIERGVTVKGRGGAVEQQWEECQAGVRARIQPLAATEEVENRTRIQRATHTVFCDLAISAVPDGSRYRVRDEGGAYYTVLAKRMPEQIGSLLELDGVKTPWPLG